MATKSTTQAHLTAVGMSGSDAQIATLLSALGTTSHDDVATFIAAADASFTRTTSASVLVDKAVFIALSSSDELKLWRYRQLWSKVRPTDADATLVSAGWLQTRAALDAIG
tara:strand:- start:99 stop:431 length:333 start_codon:yes stop_codon:yes gene_type:complete